MDRQENLTLKTIKMRISKQDACDTANKMVQSKEKELDKVKKELSDLAYQIAKNTIKKEVIECYEKFRGYFNHTSTVNISGTGLNYEQIHFTPALPKTDSGAWYISATVNDKVAKQILVLSSHVKAKNKEIQQLRKDIEIAIISLGTIAKLASEFKEAVAFLPVKIKAELTVNIQDIKKRL